MQPRLVTPCVFNSSATLCSSIGVLFSLSLVTQLLSWGTSNLLLVQGSIQVIFKFHLCGVYSDSVAILPLDLSSVHDLDDGWDEDPPTRELYFLFPFCKKLKLLHQVQVTKYSHIFKLPYLDHLELSFFITHIFLDTP